MVHSNSCSWPLLIRYRQDRTWMYALTGLMFSRTYTQWFMRSHGSRLSFRKVIPPFSFSNLPTASDTPRPCFQSISGHTNADLHSKYFHVQVQRKRFINPNSALSRTQDYDLESSKEYKIFSFNLLSEGGVELVWKWKAEKNIK